MKIIIEDGLSIAQNRGVGQYTLMLVSLLSDLNVEYSLERKYFLENIKNNTLRRILYILWLNTFFVLKLLCSKNVSFVIFPSTMVPFLKIKKIKYISILHDILSKVHPECRTTVQNLHANFAAWTAINYADKIITVSEFSKNEICKYYKINTKNLFVVNCSFSANLTFLKTENKKILEKLNIESKKYILSVGTVHKHKNAQMLIDAFEQIANNYPDIKLVLIGQSGNCKLSYNHPNVIFAGFVSNEELNILYQNALLYVFPSIYEGFGIPCIDAQKYEVPLLCSDIPVFREVAGEGANYCEPTRNSFARAIEAILNDENMQKDNIQKGKNNLSKYSKDNIKKQLIEVIR